MTFQIVLGLGLALAAASPIAAQIPQNPQQILAGLYKADTKGHGGPVFDNEPPQTMQQVFSGRFNRAWNAAMRHNHDYPVIDADPFTGDQAEAPPKVLQINVEAASATTMVLVATIAGASAPPRPRNIRFSFILEDGQWHIDEIEYPGTQGPRPKLRAYLESVK